MEKLYEFKLSSYHTMIYKDYCEVDEEDLLGSHKTDETDIVPSYLKFNTFRKEFDYDRTFLDEETFVKNYSNLCAEPHFSRVILSVEKNDDKVSLKMFSYNKSRQVGKKYFRKNTVCHFVTYNLKQNCLYSGYVRDYHLKKKTTKKLIKNNWFNKQLQSFSQIWVNSIRGMRLGDFDKIEQSKKDVNEAIKIFLSNIPGVDMNINGFDNIIYKKYLDGNGIKLPNNWMNFDKTYPQITKKVFKKYKFKFVDTFMGFHGLYGDKVKRVLHQVNTTCGVQTLKFSLYFFGKDFILSQPDDLIKEILESQVFFMDWETHINQNRYTLDNYTKNELKNCFEIFKLVIRGEINLNSFTDHIVYKEKLRQFEPVTWKSNSYNKFNEEHYNWSEKVSSIGKAQYRRIYDEKFKEFIEKQFKDFYPVILTDTREYSMESFTQSNCVRTYDNKPASIILSIRQGEIDSKKRATVEYKINGDNDRITFTRVQSLGRHNEKLDNSWDLVLHELDNRMEYTLEHNIFKLPEVEIKQGNKTFMSHLIFVDNYAEVILGESASKLPKKILKFDSNYTIDKYYNPILDIV